MVEIEIDDRKELCFMIKRGTKNNIVLPIKSLIRIDYKRIKEMDEQEGELMRIMRDTELDNGTNALVLYESLFKVVPILQPKMVNENKELDKKDDKPTEAPKVKRSVGRPKGSKKNKN